MFLFKQRLKRITIAMYNCLQRLPKMIHYHILEIGACVKFNMEWHWNHRAIML